MARQRDPLTYHAHARRDLRPWGMFVIGAVFAYAGWTVDPLDNCNDSGECAPWLVPLAFVLGAGLGLAGLAQLLANPQRGSRIDPATGHLTWWQNRTATHAGDHGHIAPTQIGLIRVVPQDDSADAVHLYDLAGERQHFFDEEVIGDPRAWAQAMKQRWPHIRVRLD
jgi:hypothetical protein